MPPPPREDLEAVRRLPYVGRAELEELMLTVEVDGQEHMLMITEDYPGGEPASFGDEVHQLKPGRLADLVEQLRDMTRQDTQLTQGSEMFEYQTSSTLDPVGEDAARFEAVFGDRALERRAVGSGEWVTLKLPIADRVDKQTAVAWGLTPRSTVDITFKFDSNDYIERGRPPIVEVLQGGKQFQLGQQIRAMLAIHLERCWMSNHFAAPGTGAAQTLSVTNVPLPQLAPAQREVYVQLLDMGFELDHATFAAANCATVEEALDFDVEAFLRRERARLASTLPKGDELVYNPDTDPNKLVPASPSRGFLLHAADYVFHRLPTSSQYCVICDKPHLFGASMLRASVCSRDVCVFAFQELQVGSDAADTIATDGGVIDLLIKIFKAAVRSQRAEKILTPYPHVMHPSRPREAIFDPKSPDLKQLKTVIDMFPSVSEILGCDSIAQLKAKTTARDFRVFPLIEWIVNSNRALIVKMPKSALIATMNTDHQFLLITAPPDKQKAFTEAKKKCGTKFAFHGSGIENWHAILRGGLRNLSNTELMTSGAAHGAGIYFACEAQTSIGYCRNQAGADTKTEQLLPGLINDQGMICLALCEIVSDAINDHGWCWTVADESKVMTRFFFVFEAGKSNSAASTKNTGFMEEVKAAMAFYNVE